MPLHFNHTMSIMVNNGLFKISYLNLGFGKTDNRNLPRQKSRFNLCHSFEPGNNSMILAKSIQFYDMFIHKQIILRMN